MPRLRSREPVDDHVIQLRRVSWADYERILRIRGDRSGPRITYLEGVLEIMAPGFDHERLKSYLGCLVEVYCLERGIEFQTLGSWTLKSKRLELGAEADECFIFGTERHRRPHLAIEVEWTSGNLDKLEVYRKLGVREVWRWSDGKLALHALRGDVYEAIERSEVLPELDLALLVSFLDRPTTSQAMQGFRAALQKKRRPGRRKS